jgi:hypothetical protein
MRDVLRASDILAISLVGAVAGCTAGPTGSATRLEQSIAANCRSWEERALKAAHPDAETIARHDQLIAQSRRYADEALAKHNDVAARQAAIANQVQAEIYADAIYDWRYDLKAATDCWDELNFVEGVHREQRARLNQLAQQLEAQAQSPSSSPPRASLYTLQTQPPLPPSPSPIPNLGSVYVPPQQTPPNPPAMPGPYLGRVPGGPDVYGVPAAAVPRPPTPLLQ